MNKYKRYYGLIIFIVTILLAGYFAYNAVVPMITEQQQLEDQKKSKQSELDQLKGQSRVVADKIVKDCEIADGEVIVAREGDLTLTVNNVFYYLSKIA